MKQNKRKILVTNALTYANGPIHLGHLVGYIQSDIWVRFQKLCGHDCTYICGSDCHGTPIMLHAEKENIAPEKLVAQIQKQQEQDCKDFLIDLDNYCSTHSEENRASVETIYKELNKRGDITKKIIEQAYDPVKNMFLPDRFVKGECPRCGAKDQYGDSCEECGATYSPNDLKNPISVLSGTTPITKSSEHYFFALPHYEKTLREWTKAGHLQEQVSHKLDEWFEHGLRDWDISRDAPYFGFKIPGESEKYFYVWLDAPIGYIAAFKNLCERQKELTVKDYWDKDSKAELYHFLGKDIMYFHALFWPAILMSANLRTPTAIFVHGFLTINGEKMSKSRGTFIKGRTYLNHLEPEYLRYYFAAKLSSRMEDLDLNLEDFRLRINSDLVGKVVNIASRCAGFINKRFDNKLSGNCAEPELLKEFIDTGNKIAELFEQREFSHAVRNIMALADRANQYIDEKKPWKLIKEEGKEKEVQEICSVGLNLFRLLAIYLKPILPNLAEKSESFLNIKDQTWEDRQETLINHKINKFIPLMQRIETASLEGIIEEEKN
jgi:methionyl-tRNA synthetase